MTKKLVLSLIGPPGSGKGSYGRQLAQALDCSLIGMSDVLREMRPELDLSSGRLVEDEIVTQSLEDYFQRHVKDDGRGYLLDGFPRTIRQLRASSSHLTIDAAIQLAVPDFVCETKLIGRRFCKKCNGNFNVNGVEQDGWRMPPTRPASSDCSEEQCQWITRSDDQLGVVHTRLLTYHQHTAPIVEYFEQHARLLKLTPYTGFEEVPSMIEQVQDFLLKK
jgi:adenylate kinase